MSIRYLSVENIIALHNDQIRRFGGVAGILEFGLLASAVARPQVAFGNQEAYPSLELKAAVLCHSLLKNHSFRDGNKRTTILSLGVFLRANGYRLKTSSKELVEFALEIENNILDEKKIALWIAERMQKVPNG